MKGNPRFAVLRRTSSGASPLNAVSARLQLAGHHCSMPTAKKRRAQLPAQSLVFAWLSFLVFGAAYAMFIWVLCSLKWFSACMTPHLWLMIPGMYPVLRSRQDPDMFLGIYSKFESCPSNTLDFVTRNKQH